MDLDSLYAEFDDLSYGHLKGITYNLTKNNRLDDKWWGHWFSWVGFSQYWAKPGSCLLEQAVLAG